MSRGEGMARSVLGVAAGVAFFAVWTTPGAAAEPVFLRGDANMDGRVSISDALMMHWTPSLNLPCPDAADANDDGAVEDTWVFLNMIFSPDFARQEGFTPALGPDPTPNDPLGCGNPAVEPPPPAQASVTIEPAVGSPGQVVETTVSITNSEEIQAIQLIIGYDPAWAVPQMTFVSDRDFVSLEGTVYEGVEQNKLWFTHHLPDVGIVVLGFLGKYFPDGRTVLPGEDQPLFKLRWRILQHAPEGTVVAPRLTNGPEGNGVLPPVHLLNEVTVDGRAKLLEVPLVTPPTEQPFLRGDVNADGRASISDAVMFRMWLSAGLGLPDCLDAADVDDNGLLEIHDMLALWNLIVARPENPWGGRL